MLVIVLVAFFFSTGYCNLLNDPLVFSKVGIIRGRHASDGNYNAFLGIPYAKINKANPFGDSHPQPPFRIGKIFDAVDDTAKCPQQDLFTNTILGDLDCLQLNIYVPDSASHRNKLPVMVWIHGGSFELGSKQRIQWGPKFLVRYDVVVVTINYRVGPYGFMCLDIPEVSGNQGIKDQQTALRWIKKNIAAFGGDDKNITLFGESSGSASVDLQLRFNKDNTFHKVIMESGSASSGWGIRPADYQRAIKIANGLGFNTTDSREAVQYLIASDPLDVIAASLQISATSPMFPCPEIEFPGIPRLVSDYARNVAIPQVKTTPILLGTNDNEWLLKYVGNQSEQYFQTLPIFQIDLLVSFNFTLEELIENVGIVQRFYLGADGLTRKNYVQISDFDTDSIFTYPAKLSIDEYLANGATSIYNYLFSNTGKRNYSQVRLNVTLDAAIHGDEMGYIWDVFFLDEPNEADQLKIDRMTTMWTNFAKYGDPTPDGPTDLLPVKWPKVTAESRSYLSINTTYTASELMFRERIAFWDLFYSINKTKRIGYKPELSTAN